jgi:phage terminase large subunit-like protein
MTENITEELIVKKIKLDEIKQKYVDSDNFSIKQKIQYGIIPPKKALEFIQNVFAIAEKKGLNKAEYLEKLWVYNGRKKQFLPDGDWETCLFAQGRGAGKTRTGSETVRGWATLYPSCRIALVGQNPKEIRRTMIEGASGILSVHRNDERPEWSPAKGELIWANGSKAFVYSAETPDALRGPQHHFAWGDELCAWENAEEVWDMMEMGLRLDDFGFPRVVVTTTPKPTDFIRNLAKDEKTVVVSGSTYENMDNLSEKYIEKMIRKYEGTTLGKQELHAVILDDSRDALFNRENLEKNRITYEEFQKLGIVDRLIRICVAVDPQIKKGMDERSTNETGIIVCGGDGDNFYILEDASINGTPTEWGNEVVRVFNKWKADIVIGETNQGGDMVKNVIETININIPVSEVRATRGKYTRAVPISGLYEQDRVFHVGEFEKLENQMCTYTPNSKVSPDRLDALVWGLTDMSENCILYAFY